MKFKLGIIIISAFLLVQESTAQKVVSINKNGEVKIGNRTPDVIIKNIINFPKSDIRMSSLKGKLVIFDFGNTSCAPCIKLLPKLDSLQKAFGDKLQVFFVIPEDKARGQKFLQTNPDIKGLNIPIITGDAVLKNLFPHVFEPFECWVDETSTLIARTEKDYVNYRNIDDVLNKRPVNFIMQYDESYDRTQPLVILNNTNIPPPKNSGMTPKAWYNTVSTYLDGVATNYYKGIDSLNNSERVSLINRPILDIYLSLVDHSIPLSQISIEVADPSRIEYRSNFGYQAEWAKKNMFCFESALPLSMTPERRKENRMREMDTFFGYYGREEERNVESWIIRKKDVNGSDIFISTAITREHMPKSFDSKKNLSLYFLVGRMNWNEEGFPPVFDETGFSKNQQEDYFMPGLLDTHDFNDIKIKLNNYGLDLVKETRKVKMFVLSDSK